MRPEGLWLAGLLCLAACATGQGTAVPDEGPLAGDGTPCIPDRAALMAMDYWTFDQDPSGSRSVYTRPGCELAAADLVRDYHAALRAKGEPVTHTFPQGTISFGETGEVSMLYWHEGQMRAFAGQTQQAVDLFRASVDADQYKSAAKRHYAMATVAFLEGDRDALQGERAALAAIAPGDDLNLGVVDGLVACFGRSYKDAYGAAECDRRPGRQPATD